MRKATVQDRGSKPSKTASLPKTTVTTTRVEEFDGPAPRHEETREPKPSIDGYIRRLTPEELAQHSFYIYRLSDAVTNREGPLYLKRLNQIDLSQIELGVLSDSIKDFTCRRFGGSKYKVKVINHNLGRGLYTLTFEIEGQPILSERETWTGAGQPPPQPAGQPPRASKFDDSMRKLIVGSVREQFDKMREQRSQPPPGLNPNELVRQVVDMMGAAHKASIEMAQR